MKWKEKQQQQENVQLKNWVQEPRKTSQNELSPSWDETRCEATRRESRTEIRVRRRQGRKTKWVQRWHSRND